MYGKITLPEDKPKKFCSFPKTPNFLPNEKARNLSIMASEGALNSESVSGKQVKLARGGFAGQILE